MMGTYGGETRFSIPDFASTTAGPVTMTGESNLWDLVKSINQKLAASRN